MSDSLRIELALRGSRGSLGRAVRAALRAPAAPVPPPAPLPPSPSAPPSAPVPPSIVWTSLCSLLNLARVSSSCLYCVSRALSLARLSSSFHAAAKVRDRRKDTEVRWAKTPRRQSSLYSRHGAWLSGGRAQSGGTESAAEEAEASDDGSAAPAESVGTREEEDEEEDEEEEEDEDAGASAIPAAAFIAAVAAITRAAALSWSSSSRIVCMMPLSDGAGGTMVRSTISSRHVGQRIVRPERSIPMMHGKHMLWEGRVGGEERGWPERGMGGA